MQDVLGLLSVSSWLLQGLNDERSGGRQHSDGTLSVLHSNLDLDFNALPLSSCLLDVFSDFLGRQTDWTALWCKSSGTSNFTADHFHVDYKQSN